MPKKLKPIHPGEHLREDFMTPLGLAPSALAEALDISSDLIKQIIAERRKLDADTALRLARFFGTDAESWLNLQSHYDIQCAEDAAGRSLKRIRPWKAPRKCALA